jgi:PAS domain S-box-containing protein
MVESISESSSILMDLRSRATVKVLLVDDDLSLLKIAKKLLEMQGGFEVDTASCVEEATDKLKKGNYDAIVSDFEMPGKDGLEFLKELRTKGNPTPFIIFTGKGREEVAVEALNSGADYYLSKTLNSVAIYPELANDIRIIVGKRRAGRQLCYDSWLLQNISDAIIAVDENLRIISWNSAAENLYGWKAEEVIGKSFMKVFLEQNSSETHVQEDIQTLKEKGFLHKVVHLGKTGKHINVEINVILLRGENGGIKGYVSVNRDVTERHRMVEALKQSESTYRTLAENLPVAVYREYLEENGRTQFFNGMVRSMTGYAPEELTRGDICSIDPLIFSEDRARVVDEVKSAVREKRPFQVEYRVKHKNGSIHPFQEWGRPRATVMEIRFTSMGSF